jgi:hypothetical protein
MPIYTETLWEMYLITWKPFGQRLVGIEDLLGNVQITLETLSVMVKKSGDPFGRIPRCVSRCSHWLCEIKKSIK